MSCTASHRPLRASLTGESAEPLVCERTEQHRGQHQAVEHVPAIAPDPSSEWSWLREGRRAYDALTTWSEGGASSFTLGTPAELAAACTTCKRVGAGLSAYGDAHDPADHAIIACVHCGARFHNLGHSRRDQHPDTRDGWCFHCAEWISRAIRYADPDTGLVRPHDHSPALGGTGRLYGWGRATGAFGGWHVTVTWDDGRTAGPRDSLWDAGAIPVEWLDYFPPNAVVESGETIARAGHTNRAGRPLTYTGHP